jgi:hypothetical protein
MARGSLVAGARIRVRNAEWVVGQVDRRSTAGAIVHAVGLSGIVRDKNAIFVESVERRQATAASETSSPGGSRRVPTRSSCFPRPLTMAPVEASPASTDLAGARHHLSCANRVQSAGTRRVNCLRWAYWGRSRWRKGETRSLIGVLKGRSLQVSVLESPMLNKIHRFTKNRSATGYSANAWLP